MSDIPKQGNKRNLAAIYLASKIIVVAFVIVGAGYIFGIDFLEIPRVVYGYIVN